MAAAAAAAVSSDLSRVPLAQSSKEEMDLVNHELMIGCSLSSSALTINNTLIFRHRYQHHQHQHLSLSHRHHHHHHHSQQNREEGGEDEEEEKENEEEEKQLREDLLHTSAPTATLIKTNKQQQCQKAQSRGASSSSSSPSSLLGARKRKRWAVGGGGGGGGGDGSSSSSSSRPKHMLMWSETMWGLILVFLITGSLLDSAESKKRHRGQVLPIDRRAQGGAGGEQGGGGGNGGSRGGGMGVEKKKASGKGRWGKTRCLTLKKLRRKQNKRGGVEQTSFKCKNTSCSDFSSSQMTANNACNATYQKMQQNRIFRK